MNLYPARFYAVAEAQMSSSSLASWKITSPTLPVVAPHVLRVIRSIRGGKVTIKKPSLKKVFDYFWSLFVKLISSEEEEEQQARWIEGPTLPNSPSNSCIFASFSFLHSFACIWSPSTGLAIS
jgi:hypothetical protein